MAGYQVTALTMRFINGDGLWQVAPEAGVEIIATFNHGIGDFINAMPGYDPIQRYTDEDTRDQNEGGTCGGPQHAAKKPARHDPARSSVNWPKACWDMGIYETRTLFYFAKRSFEEFPVRLVKMCRHF